MFIVVEEIGFYYAHRLFHTKRFYGPIHKMHHQFTAPVAVAAIYCHPLEHLIANALPVLMGPFLMGSHLAVLMAWQTITVTTAIITHSGYHIPFFPSPEAHDFHHLRYTVNYGVLGNKRSRQRL